MSDRFDESSRSSTRVEKPCTVFADDGASGGAQQEFDFRFVSNVDEETTESKRLSSTPALEPRSRRSEQSNLFRLRWPVGRFFFRLVPETSTAATNERVSFDRPKTNARSPCPEISSSVLTPRQTRFDDSGRAIRLDWSLHERVTDLSETISYVVRRVRSQTHGKRHFREGRTGNDPEVS